MGEWPTFWTELTGREQRALRRFTHTPSEHMPKGKLCPGWPADIKTGHDATSEPIGEYRERLTPEGYRKHTARLVRKSDPRWPKQCQHCDYRFVNEDEWQVWTDSIYRNPKTGERWPRRELPIGAMYDAWWEPPDWKGFDGIGLSVILPPDRRWWLVDAQANNCTMKEDRKPRKHRCWIRHGDPRTEPVTVDKAGVTCGAGAGSILTPNWHGFLQGGVLRG